MEAAHAEPEAPLELWRDAASLAVVGRCGRPGVVGRWRLRPLRGLGAALAVRLILLAQYFNVAFTAVMLGGLFDAYLLLLGGSNKFVGTVESIRGLAALVVALPLGWAGDRWPKSRVLRINVLCGGGAAGMLAAGFPTDALGWIIAGVVITAIHNQCISTLLPPLLAEVTSAGGQRTEVMSHSQTVRNLGSASGPAVQIVVLALSGTNTWTTRQLHAALLLGLPFFCVYAPLIWRVGAMANATGSEAEGARLEDARPVNAHASDGAASPGRPSDTTNMSFMRWLIAALCEASSLVTAIGSGMTFKYWPLFFKGDFGFSPIGVCAMQLAIMVAIAATAQSAPVLGKLIGRLPAASVFHVSGTLLLFAISSQGLGVFVEVPLVIARNALMNAGTPLEQALILDLVPKEHRGKWSSIASLARTTWAGSAFVGGVLSDSHDYRYAFFITACVHSGAGALLLFVTVLWRHSPDPAVSELRRHVDGLVP